MGLLVLSKIFLWTFSKPRHGGHWQGGNWRRHYWKEKLGGMTPEERESFKQKMKERWCRPVSGTSAPDSGTSNG
jgi:hypothetical protein